MTEIVFFHHVLGLTPGVWALAETLRRAGHVVHTPDLYEGRTFETLDEGVAHAQSIGFENVVARGIAAAASLPSEVVYAGISLGVMSAQTLVQTRAGARGALLLEACVAPEYLDGRWPAGLRAQIHGMDADPSFAGEGDLDAAKALAAANPAVELYLYAGDRHLFTDSSLPSYDAAATELVVARMLDFLAKIE